MIQRKEVDGTTPEFEKEKNKLLAFAAFVMQYRDVYYDLSRLLCIACTLPVTSAAAERLFRCVKLINHVRFTTVKSVAFVIAFRQGKRTGLRPRYWHVFGEVSELSYTALYLNFKHVEFMPCINRLTPRPVVYRLNVFVLVAFEFLPYLEIKLTFECTAWFYGLAPPLAANHYAAMSLGDYRALYSQWFYYRIGQKTGATLHISKYLKKLPKIITLHDFLHASM